ncbi:GNAT family N-acetyltransferase [Piscibacillus sp. B03]|uniref:GNAT family N-acetyltransferase n=1 Tax=Piscibacillus sp. B03 TaxID=3457430 RepID=UPI003FCD634E
MQFYIYEFSKYIPDIKLEHDGSYKRFNLERYWNSDNFHAHFIMLDDELIGFSLVQSATQASPNSVEEFFIMSNHSGQDYGKDVAKKLFGMYPGEWRITQIENNRPAYAFWNGLVNEVTNGRPSLKGQPVH